MARKLSLRKCAIEMLESRCFLSAHGIASPQLVVMQTASVTNPDPIGYTPAEIRAAYGFDQVAYNGAGQTIAIIDAFNDPNIAADVATFSRQFGLQQFNVPGGPTLRVESQTGSTTVLPKTDGDWSQEIALDVEWAHAIAPGANILLVEANSDNFSDLLLATNHAKVQPAVSVISVSWDGDEFRGETSWDPAFLARRGHIGQTFVAAAGDDGSPAEWPAVSPWVLSVGGTSLNLVDGAYAGESGWSSTSGGVAQFEAEPSFQTRVQSTGGRAAPDVAFDGDPNTGVAVYNSVPNSIGTGWAEIGGTSAGTPQWAALIALADQGRVQHGLGTLSNAQSILYNLPATDFHDITLGGNGVYPAGPGYDAVTGLGSPLANLVIQHLVEGVPPGAGPPVSGNTGVVNVGVWISRDPLPTAAAAFIGVPSTVALPFGGEVLNAWRRNSVIPSVATTLPPVFDPDTQTRSEEGPRTRDLLAPANDSGVLRRDNSTPVASWADGISQASLDAAIDEGLEPVYEVLTEGWSSRFSVP
jgi:subtilase family serine protease